MANYSLIRFDKFCDAGLQAIDKSMIPKKMFQELVTKLDGCELVRVKKGREKLKQKEDGVISPPLDPTI
ncbi:hypothetical protein AtEden1_Chr4g0279421 [Arabidopsis thaliana]